MKLWSFNDDGSGNGQVVGPFSLPCKGMMYLGGAFLDPVNGPLRMGNVMIRAHFLSRPSVQMFNLGVPSDFLDGLPLGPGSYVKLSQAYDQWYFSVLANGTGFVGQYWFLLIESGDECFEAGNAGLQAAPVF